MKRYCYNCINDCGKVRGNLCVIAVAPYAGAWIEIDLGSGPSYSVPSSLPTRERGLKSVPDGHAIVLPPGRSLRGSVD